MNETIYLDLCKITLYGYEDKKSTYIINSVIKGILMNDTFDPVEVFRINDSQYELTDGGT